MIQCVPLGLTTPTGENGASLSGGQRQRVAIARSLLRDAPIVCLDEPTAALDAKSENYIKDSLGQMIEGKTVVMVTHRKALLALMDTVYVLENSKLVDVNELGGLDAYRAKLEGIEVEIQKNKDVDAPDAKMHELPLEDISQQPRHRKPHVPPPRPRAHKWSNSRYSPSDGVIYINHNK